jgi:hypothetical protein
MSTYIAERYLPGITQEQLLDAARRAKLATADLTTAGTPVTYLRSTFLPGDQTCYCLFEGPSEQAVREANDKAEIPYERIIPAVYLASEDLS